MLRLLSQLLLSLPVVLSIPWPSVHASAPAESQPWSSSAVSDYPSCASSFMAGVEPVLRSDLSSLFNETGGASHWYRFDGWNTSADVCSWWGVTCGCLNGSDSNTFVYSLQLSANNLRGIVPSPLLSQSGPWLQSLNLSQNLYLNGSILFIFEDTHDHHAATSDLPAPPPSRVCDHFPLLQSLSVNNTMLRGNFSDFAHCASIVSLDLSDSMYSGRLADLQGLTSLQSLSLRLMPALFGKSDSFPSSLIWPSLRRLDVTNFGMSGTLDWMDAAPHGCGQLESIILTSNNVTGLLPNLSLCSRLTEFIFESPRSGLSGPLWSNWSAVASLIVLRLSGHSQLTPSSDWFGISMLQNLTELDLSGASVGLYQGPNVSPFSCSDSNANSSSSDLHPLTLLPRLRRLVLVNCALCGRLPVFTQSQLAQVSLSLNPGLYGEIPVHFVSAAVNSLATLRLAACSLSGPVPLGFLTSIPIETLDISRNQLTGDLNAHDFAPGFDLFDASFNNLTGFIPLVIGARTLDLSHNQFVGGFSSSDVWANNSEQFVWYNTTSVNVGYNNLTCVTGTDGRIPWFNFTTANLTSLDLQHNQLSCDIGALLMQLPNSLQQLNVAHNTWHHSLLHTIDAWPSGLHSLVLTDVGLRALSDNRRSAPRPLLTSLILNNNDLSDLGIVGFASFMAPMVNIRLISISNCNLSLPVNQLAMLLANQMQLEHLDASFNQLYGAIPALLLLPHASDTAQPTSMPTTMRNVVLNGNAGLTGALPVGSPAYAYLERIELGATSVSRRLPASWTSLTALTQLGLTDLLPSASRQLERWSVDIFEPQPACMVERAALYDPACFLPQWIHRNEAAPLVHVANDQSLMCPVLQLFDDVTSQVALDLASGKTRGLCDCSDGYFGSRGVCQRCPPDVHCSDSSVLTGAYPDNAPPLLWSDVFPLDSPSVASRPPYRTNFLLCPLAANGEVLCNPHGMRWPMFDPDTLAKLDQGALAWSEVLSTEVSGWCRIGHQNRLCSQCARDFFSSGGRSCLRCPSRTWQYVFVVVQISAVVVFMLALWITAPKAEDAPADLLHTYDNELCKANRRRVRHQNRHHVHEADRAEADHHESAVDVDQKRVETHDRDEADRADEPHVELEFHPIASSTLTPASAPVAALHPSLQAPHAESPDVAAPASFAEAAEGISGLPDSRVRFLSSAGAYMNLPRHEGSLQDAEDAPSFSLPPRAASAATPHARGLLLGVPPSSVGHSPWRLLTFHLQQMSVILSAQTALPQFQTWLVVGSGISAAPSGLLVGLDCLTQWGPREKVRLALLPPLSIACATAIILVAKRSRQVAAEQGAARSMRPAPGASVWRRAQLATFRIAEWLEPHSVRMLGLLLSVAHAVAYPCAQLSVSMLSCTDLRSISEAQPDPFLNLYPWQTCDDHWRSDILPAAVLGSAMWLLFAILSSFGLVAARKQLLRGERRWWPLVASMCTPYQTRYWYWEQILLLRRLTLAVIVAAAPVFSVSVMVLLFLLIQLSALLEHVCNPYVSSWYHFAELASLYLLLSTYFVSVLLRSLDDSTLALSGEVWSSLLLVCNGVFIFGLVCAFLSSVRRVVNEQLFRVSEVWRDGRQRLHYWMQSGVWMSTAQLRAQQHEETIDLHWEKAELFQQQSMEAEQAARTFSSRQNSRLSLYRTASGIAVPSTSAVAGDNCQAFGPYAPPAFRPTPAVSELRALAGAAEVNHFALAHSPPAPQVSGHVQTATENGASADDEPFGRDSQPQHD